MFGSPGSICGSPGCHEHDQMTQLIALISCAIGYIVCPGKDVYFQVLGMTVELIHCFQGMAFKLRPCLRSRACG